MCAPAEPSALAEAVGTPELGEVLRRHGERYIAAHPVSPVQQKVFRALSQCRTAALGGHLEACNHCGHRRAVYHSCRNRHCPKCQTLAQADWLEARRADLLPVDYFHVVFTLPHEICPLALYRPRVIYALLFRAATDTLATFARDSRYFSDGSGGTLGIRNEYSFRSPLPTAHTLACLRFAGPVTETVARLTTGSGGLTLRRAGFAPAGRRTKFQGVIAIPPIPIDQQCLVALNFLLAEAGFQHFQVGSRTP
jgi:hypothetical protein